MPITRSANGLVSCGNAGVKVVGHRNTSTSSKYRDHAVRAAIRRASCSTTALSGAKSSGSWKAKNSPTWKPNDSASRVGSTPCGQPSTTSTPAAPSASTAFDSTAPTSPDTGASRWSSTTPTRKSASLVLRGGARCHEYARAAGPSGPPVTRSAVRRSAADRASGPTDDRYRQSLGAAVVRGTWKPVSGTVSTLGLRP